MVSAKALFSTATLASLAIAAPVDSWKPANQCGKVDVYFTGLPPNHPTVISQGYDPKFVADALARDKARILQAGYNLKTVLLGPEQSENIHVENLKSNPSGVTYEVAAIGFGVRGGPYLNLTVQFENDIALFRQKLPQAPFVFNDSPDSTLDAIKRKAPITGDCSKTPGKDYGTYTFCSPSVCTAPF